MTRKNHSPIDRSIALIGYRGSGKSTVGRALAAMLSVPLIDTDERIVRVAGKPISEIFADEGEDGFRELEKQVIRELRGTPTSVISVGGGAVIDPENVVMLRSVATILWLTAPRDILADRILGDTKSSETRPALTDRSSREEVNCLLQERIPLYRQAADHTVDTEAKTPAAIAALILGLCQDH